MGTKRSILTLHKQIEKREREARTKKAATSRSLLDRIALRSK